MDGHNPSLERRAHPQEIGEPLSVVSNDVHQLGASQADHNEPENAEDATKPSGAGLQNVRSIPFKSILFSELDRLPSVGESQQPDCFKDLNLDQIVATITAGREEYDLKPFFHAALTDSIVYRQEIMRDVEDVNIRAAIEPFAAAMRAVRASSERNDQTALRPSEAGPAARGD